MCVCVFFVQVVVKAQEQLGAAVRFEHRHHPFANVPAENGYIKLCAHFKWALNEVSRPSVDARHPSSAPPELRVQAALPAAVPAVRVRVRVRVCADLALIIRNCIFYCTHFVDLRATLLRTMMLNSILVCAIRCLLQWAPSGSSY